MDLRLLGPVELWVDGRAVAVGPSKQRCVLAVLALEANHVVPVETVADRVWSHDPPAAARALVQTYVARLRKVLAECGAHRHAALTYRSGGYVLTIDPELVDLHRFRRLLAQNPDIGTLQQALALWRGTPLSGVEGAWTRRMRDVLTAQHLAARRQLLDAQLDAGHHDEALGQLEELLASDPLDEKLIRLRMLALHRAGRQAEALGCYRHARSRLLEELGDEPGPELRDLHQQLLRRDPALRQRERPQRHDATATVPTLEPTAGPTAALTRGPTLVPTVPVPRQLPAHTPNFVGRDAELRRLCARLDSAAGSGATTIFTIGGPAGIGKTALAVYWARRAAHRFPDGQLYVNLRGFDPAGTPMRTAEAIRGFLDALQIPAERIPVNPDAQVTLYRTLLADRRVLVVLDNARDVDQVRPLLPGGPHCAVVITSRNQLPGLVVQEGASPMALDVLDDAEAAALLANQLGHDRVAAEPVAVADLIERCGRLPLALAIVAARAALNPRLSLPALATEMADEQTRLDALDAGEVSLRSAFSWSYQQLEPATGRLFRLLGTHPGPSISLAAAASLAGIPRAGAREALGELTRACLVAEPVSGRFTFHDLLRAYARDQAHAVDSVTERREATHRTLDHYLHTAHAVARTLDPHRDPIAVVEPRPGVAAERIVAHDDALAWCDTEHAVLLAVIAQAVSAGFDTHAWQLAWTLATYFLRRGHWHDHAAAQRIALAATRRLGDRTGQARAHHNLAAAYGRLGLHDKNATHLQQALKIYEALDNRTGQAHIHLGFAWLFEYQHRLTEALDHAKHALHLYRSTGHLAGQAKVLNRIGWQSAQLGDPDRALVSCQQALDLYHALGDQHGAAETWDSLGYAYQQLGQHTKATTCYQQALDSFREFGDGYSQAVALIHLGDTHNAAGDPAAARDAWRQAVRLLDDLQHPDAKHVRAKLDAVSSLVGSARTVQPARL